MSQIKPSKTNKDGMATGNATISKTAKKNMRQLHCTTINSGNLGKISQNFSNLIARQISDVSSDDDEHGYLSSYMNISQSPEEIYKRLRRPSKDMQSYPDSASAAGKSSSANFISAAKAKETMTGAKKKSILKKNSSNQYMNE